MSTLTQHTHACSSLWAVPEEAVDIWRHQLDEKGTIHPWHGSPCAVCKVSRGCGQNGWSAEYSELHRGGNDVERLVCCSCAFSCLTSTACVYSTPYEVWAIICSLPTCPPLHLVTYSLYYLSIPIAHSAVSVAPEEDDSRPWGGRHAPCG